MALYKTHVRFNLFIFLPILLTVLFLLHTSLGLTLISSLAFVYATLFMNPDADLAKNNKLFSLKGLLTLPFRSYSFFFRHRGISHHPIFGSFTRIIWLAGFCFLISLIIEIPTWQSFEASFVKKYQNEWLFALIGIISSDLAHLALDWHS